MNIRDILDSSRIAAEENDFPPFVGPENESTPLNASPYIARLDDLRNKRFLANRTELVVKLLSALDQLIDYGVRPVAVLLGGSAIGPKARPNDLDCAVFYEAIAGGSPQVAALQEFLVRCKADRLDMRALPIDGDPVLLLKTACYFSMLYSKDKVGLRIARGVVLVDCR